MVRVGWNFKSFFLTPTAPGGAFPVERSGITTASGTPNLITAFTAVSPCVHSRIGGTKSCLPRLLWKCSLIAFNRLLSVSDEMQEIAHVEEAHSDKAPKTS